MTPVLEAILAGSPELVDLGLKRGKAGLFLLSTKEHRLPCPIVRHILCVLKTKACSTVMLFIDSRQSKVQTSSMVSSLPRWALGPYCQSLGGLRDRQELHVSSAELA